VNPLSLIAPATVARRNAQKEAATFAATVKPGHTYYSVVDLNAKYPGAPKRALMEWTFSRPGRWIGQEARCDHMTAAGAWLGYGPIHERKPGGLMTFQELRNRPGIFGPDPAEVISHATPAGV
jgi:hypothetical protein